MDIRELIPIAKKASEKAYAPYSGFKVGAALLTKSGKIYQGCNVENASYSLTNCAERTAIFSAVADGEREFSALVVFTNTDVLFAPCGACRQVLSEFGNEIEILIVSKDKEKVTTIKELLPLGFSLNQNKK